MAVSRSESATTLLLLCRGAAWEQRVRRNFLELSLMLGKIIAIDQAGTNEHGVES